MKKKLSIRFYCLVICLMYGRKVTGSELDLTYTTEVRTYSSIGKRMPHSWRRLSSIRITRSVSA